MRSRTSLLTFVFVTSLFVLPLAAHAGGIPFFGPIIPQDANQNVCPASWGMLITVINNIISLMLTLAIVFVAPLIIAYAGFLYVVNSVKPSGISEAKTLLLNTVVGIVIALAGWLIVNAVMAVLYNPSDSTWGTWSDLITGNSNDLCLKQEGALPDDKLKQAAPGTGVTVAPGPGAGTGTLNAPPAGKAGTACDPIVVLAGADAGGYTLTNTQANILACIALPESGCRSNPNPPNYNWNSAVSSPGSTAAGAFQVLLSTNARCYENRACYAAVGSIRGPLNCASGFTNGNPKTDPAGAAVARICLQAANNLNCSASAAACLLQGNGGSFSPWQADVNSARQTGCITGGT